ncbi:hypothetical protein M9Y10_034477 [Tritrichomonas musculus]|uniref:DDE-1 domain-containing protein n=1 Tax=Tritrichomonas musculus TaxID=1915356 RepID=A0ABR2KFK7_9EUKA
MNDFKNRHKKSIEKVKADSLEENRAQISIEEVNRYFREIDEMTNDPPIPLLLINFDEIGFGRRQEKGKRKGVYIFKQCKVRPFFRDLTDQYHVSVVVGVSSGCTDIIPLFLSTRKNLDDDIHGTFFHRRANYYSTPKGIATTESTIYWIEYSLAPYVQLNILINIMPISKFIKILTYLFSRFLFKFNIWSDIFENFVYHFLAKMAQIVLF